MTSMKEAQKETKENPFKPSKGPSQNHPRPRKGKTAKDRGNGAARKNAENKDARANWRNEGNGKRSHASFPWSACNGKANRYQVTGPCAETVFLRDNKPIAAGKSKK